MAVMAIQIKIRQLIILKMKILILLSHLVEKNNTHLSKRFSSFVWENSAITAEDHFSVKLNDQ